MLLVTGTYYCSLPFLWFARFTGGDEGVVCQVMGSPQFRSSDICGAGTCLCVFPGFLSYINDISSLLTSFQRVRNVDQTFLLLLNDSTCPSLPVSLAEKHLDWNICCITFEKVCAEFHVSTKVLAIILYSSRSNKSICEIRTTVT